MTWRKQSRTIRELARDLANQAEVLENTRFVRQIATSTGRAPKPFPSIKLRARSLEDSNLRVQI